MSEPEKPIVPAFDALPEGYHAGLLTAVTVFLGFSLSFLRFWGIESPGQWSRGGKIAAWIVGFGILFQLCALFRALSLLDEQPRHYENTVRCFFLGVFTVAVGVVVSIVVAAQP